MPKKTLKDYPVDWREISKRIKERDGWRCQECKLKFPKGGGVLKIAGKLRRITVHHKDRVPMNCADSNLITLCCACHCRAEWPLIRQEMSKKAGQVLFDF